MLNVLKFKVLISGIRKNIKEILRGGYRQNELFGV